jgi:hypothetical protein
MCQMARQTFLTALERKADPASTAAYHVSLGWKAEERTANASNCHPAHQAPPTGAGGGTAHQQLREQHQQPRRQPTHLLLRSPCMMLRLCRYCRALATSMAAWRPLHSAPHGTTHTPRAYTKHCLHSFMQGRCKRLATCAAHTIHTQPSSRPPPLQSRPLLASGRTELATRAPPACWDGAGLSAACRPASTPWPAAPLGPAGRAKRGEQGERAQRQHSANLKCWPSFPSSRARRDTS